MSVLEECDKCVNRSSPKTLLFRSEPVVFQDEGNPVKFRILRSDIPVRQMGEVNADTKRLVPPGEE